MLTLARSYAPISANEFKQKEQQLYWLVQVANLLMPQNLTPDPPSSSAATLTPREKEILCWTADGKSSEEISIILSISTHTVNFHIKNANAKLQTPNKIAAVAKAAMSGLLI